MRKRRSSPRVLALIALLTGGVFLLDSFTSRGYAVWLLYTVAVLLTAWMEWRRFAYALAVCCTLLIVAGFFLPLHGVHPGAAIVNRALGVGTLWVMAVLLERRKQAAEALRESEERYRTVADNTYDCEFWFALDGRVLYASPSCQRIYGRQAAEFLADPSLRRRVVHPDDRAAFDQHLAAVEDQRIPGGAEFRIVRPDGTQRWVGHACQPVFGEDGQYRGIRGSNRDITTHKQTEEAWRESEERFHSAFEEGAVPMALAALDGTLLRVNAAFGRMVGLSPEALVGRSFAELTHPDDLPENLLGVAAVGRGERPVFRMTKRYLHADGRVVWGDMSTAAVRDAQGAPRYLVTHVQDVTEQKEAEEARREGEERYRAVFEQSQDAIVVADPTGEGRVLSTNPAAARMFGWSEEEMIGLTRQEVMETNDLLLQRALVERARGAAIRVEVAGKRKDGSTFTGELTSSQFVDREGRPRAVVVIRDISERKRAEAERERLFAEAEEGRRMLAALMAHIPIGVTVADAPDVRIRLVSEYGRGVTGRGAAEIEGIAATEEDAHPLAWGIYHPDGVTPARDEELPLTRATKRGEVVTNEEWVLKRPDGTSLTVSCNAGPLRDAKGAITGGIIVWRDISELKRQAEDLAAERTRAELAESLRREVAHRTKNNLAMVAGLLQLQVAQQTDPEVKAALSQTHARVTTFASIQEELQSGTSEGVDLLPVLQRVGSASTGAFAGGEVAVSVRGEALPLPSSAVTNLALVANELITNGIKHGAPGPEGTLRVEVVLDPQEHWVRLCVWNSGNPTPADFDPRAQSGLGLRLIYGIAVERYRGAFVLRAEAGGTLAEVTVPREALREG